MKITISGYGKMGREIEQIALERNHSIVAILDNTNDWLAKRDDIVKSDVIIDFSQPEAILGNIQRSFKLDKPLITGTTGWDEKKEKIKEQCISENKTLFVASNFSIGVNLFYALNTYLARITRDYKNYKPAVKEIHHTQKLDNTAER